MNMIDARGLACPEPVILTRNAMKSAENAYKVIVDNPAAKENVTRYAESQNYKVSCKEEDGEYTLQIEK